MTGTGWTTVVKFSAGTMMRLFLFATASIPILGPTQPNHLVSRALSPGVKRSWREAQHSPPSSAEVKNAWKYTTLLQYVFMAKGKGKVVPVLN
jgi:hypothetical protein